MIILLVFFSRKVVGWAGGLSMVLHDVVNKMPRGFSGLRFCKAELAGWQAGSSLTNSGGVGSLGRKLDEPHVSHLLSGIFSTVLQVCPLSAPIQSGVLYSVPVHSLLRVVLSFDLCRV